MSNYKVGSPVKWKWGNGFGHGKVEKVFHRTVSRTIDGSEITRNGSEENPAYLIRGEESGEVLKLSTEIETDS